MNRVYALNELSHCFFHDDVRLSLVHNRLHDSPRYPTYHLHDSKPNEDCLSHHTSCFRKMNAALQCCRSYIQSFAVFLLVSFLSNVCLLFLSTISYHRGEYLTTVSASSCPIKSVTSFIGFFQLSYACMTNVFLLLKIVPTRTYLFSNLNKIKPMGKQITDANS